MQVTKQLGSASGHLIQFFGCREKRPSNEESLTAVSASWNKYDNPATAVRLRHSAVGNVTEMTLTAHHLHAVFWKQNKWKLGEIP
jgi:hypothetical protein